MTQFKLGQYFNIEGIKLNFRNIFRLHKIKPDVAADSILDLDLNKLKRANMVRYVVFDKDNTLTLPYVIEIEKNLENKLEEFKHIFGRDNLAILSNSAGSRDDRDYLEAKKIEEMYGIKVVRHNNKKPRVHEDILKTFDLIDKDFNTKEICVIGDRLLVDILMGKEYGYFSILVNPRSTCKENFVVKSVRKIENILLKIKL